MNAYRPDPPRRRILDYRRVLPLRRLRTHLSGVLLVLAILIFGGVLLLILFLAAGIMIP